MGLQAKHFQSHLVVWSGGYDGNSYKSFDNWDDAIALARDWAEDADPRDIVEILTIRGDGKITKTDVVH